MHKPDTEKCVQENQGAPAAGGSTAHADEARPHHAAAPDVSLRALFKLAAPLFVANIAIMGAATIDTIMAGRLGAEHLAVVALGSATTVMVLFGLVGVLQGLSPIAGHHFGARRYRAIGFELSQSLWLSLVLAVIGVIVILQTDFWIDFGGVKGNVAEMAREYFYASAWGLPAAVIMRCYIALNSAINRPRVSMYISLALLATKAPLNLLFMYGWCGFPAMGGAGAAMAMSVNSWIALIAYYVIWKRDRFYDPMRPEKFFWPQMKAIAAQLRLGVPIGLTIFFEVSSFTLMAIFISRIGTISVAAHQIVGNITATLYQVPLSLAIAVCVLVSQCLGAGYKDAARAITVRTLKCAVAITATNALLLYIFRHELVALYTPDVPVQQLAASLLIFGVIYHVTDACQSVSNFALRGYRVTVLPMILYGVLLWAVGLGGGYWLGFGAEGFGGPYGAAGFWAATTLGLILAGISLSALALYVSRTRMMEDRVPIRVVRNTPNANG